MIQRFRNARAGVLALVGALVASAASASGFEFDGTELAGISTSVGLLLAAGAAIVLIYVGYKHFRRGVNKA